MNFTAKVANDSSGEGVTWSMSGTSCSGAACGTFTNKTTTAATYNAPAAVSASYEREDDCDFRCRHNEIDVLDGGGFTPAPSITTTRSRAAR